MPLAMSLSVVRPIRALYPSSGYFECSLVNDFFCFNRTLMPFPTLF